jgi:hypothetical protein
MKQITTTLIIPLIIGLLVAYFAFYISKESVDLRYTISEKIPTKYLEYSTVENVQQLTVKNNGDIAAEKIIIKINEAINEYDILKNSATDIVKEHNTTGHFEAIYPSLPPGAQFSYIFKTSGSGLTEKGIEISHNKGKATAALSSDVASLATQIGSFAFLGMMLFYFLLFMFQIRSSIIENLESSGNYLSFYEFLSKKKPFYVPLEKWKSLRRKYIGSKCKVDYFYSTAFEELDIYKILNQDTPSYLTLDEWELFKEVATKHLVDYLSYSVKVDGVYNDFSKYLALTKPKHFSDSKWEDISNELNKTFIVSKKLNEKYYSSAKEIYNEINFGMPAGMLLSYWKDYRDYLLKRYFEVIFKEITNTRKPLRYLENIDLSILSRENQIKLKGFAYKVEFTNYDNIFTHQRALEFLNGDKPDWVSSEDLAWLIKKSENYVELNISIKKYNQLLSALEKIIHRTPLNEEKEAIVDKEAWSKILELENEISVIPNIIENDKKLIKFEKEEIQKLKDKVLKQLDIIHNAINDPKSIDRIESYDNPFSRGNFENIRRIANAIKY